MTGRGTAAARPAPSWPDHLDALEEWLRRLEASVATSGPEPTPPEVAPDGAPAPADLLRAHALLARMRAVEDLTRARRAGLRRAHAYAQH